MNATYSTYCSEDGTVACRYSLQSSEVYQVQPEKGLGSSAPNIIQHEAIYKHNRLSNEI